MADDEESVVNTPPEGVPADVHSQMLARLSGTAPTPSQEQQIQEPPAIGEPIVQPTTFSFDTLKEKYNYEKPEDVLADIEQYRNYKANPPAPQVEPLKFDNPESESIFKALQIGKVDEVRDYLSKQHHLSQLTTQDVTPDNAAEIIKLGMQVDHPELTQKEVDFQYNRKYQEPKRPVFNEDNETEDQYQERIGEYNKQIEDLQMAKIIDAKYARPSLEKAKSSLVLPTLDKEPVDEGYQAYLDSVSKRQTQDAETIAAYDAFTTPTQIETKVKFIDEANKIDFEMVYEPDAELFAQAKEIGKDFTKFWVLFANQDGSPDRTKFLKTIAFALNPEKALMQAMTQASTATIKREMADNGGNGMVRQLGSNTQLDYVAQQMKQRGII